VTHPEELKRQGTGFTYLTAERLGPRDQLDVTADEPDLIDVGIRGEYTAQALALHETREVREPLRHPDTAQHGVTTLRTQVENGVQVILETHSDHVINGIRLAAAEQRSIDPTDIVLHFFSEGTNRGPEMVELTNRGGLTAWPKGFFDQLEEDLGRLTRAKRGSR
jgi:predicted ATPase